MAQTKPKAGQFYGVSGNGTAGQVLISDGNGGMSWGSNTEQFTVSWATPTGQSLTYTQPNPQSSTGSPGGAFPTTTFTATKSGEEISGTASIAGLPTGITASQSLSGSGANNVLTVTLSGVFPGADSLNTALTISGLTIVTPLTVNYLVVAGGGGGGCANGGGGGGGAGGFLTNYASTALSLTVATNYVVTVGAGGAGGSTSSNGQPGSVGSNSVFSTITSDGGGAGGGDNTGNTQAGSGGSGGGGARYATSTGGNATAGQGYAGGTGNANTGGGGGGASSAGVNATTSTGGNGGDGLANAITVASGTGPSYAGGGGGGIESPSSASDAGTGGTGGGGNGGAAGSVGQAPTAGTANTGGGGGASGDYNTGGSHAGQTGGSGVVILRYPSGYTISGLSGTTTTVGNDKVTTFTTAGTGNIQFN